MRIVYIAGPFRGSNSWDVEQNVRRAETFAMEVWKLGAAAICPHANTRFSHGLLPDAVFLEGDLEILMRCDAVLLTPDWEKSEGTVRERCFAEAWKIPVFFDLSDLEAWLNPRLFQGIERRVGA